MANKNSKVSAPEERKTEDAMLSKDAKGTLDWVREPAL